MASKMNTCSGRAHPGTIAFANLVARVFPGCEIGRIYDCTKVAGYKTLSDHAYGRAVDIFPKDRAQGDEIFKWCIAKHNLNDITVVIWWRQIWSSLNPTIHKYTGVHPHEDHVHISLKLLKGFGLL